MWRCIWLIVKETFGSEPMDDTRAVVTYIREHGAMNAIISTEVDNIDALKAKLAEAPSMKGLDLASVVSTKEPYFYGDENATYKVSALDLGIKKNILRNLAKRDCYIKVFPCTREIALALTRSSR